MHHWLRLAALPVLLALAGATAAPDPAISYELAPQIQDGAITALDVTIRLRANASGTTTIDWLGSWAGEPALAQWTRDLRIEGATSAVPAPHGGRIVRSAPGAPLVMRYRIVSAYDADPTAGNSEQTRPIVRPGWFYAIGEILYARPVGRTDAPAHFSWTGPAGIGFASDTEHAVNGDGHPRTVADIVESIAIGGRDLRVSTRTLNGAPVRVASIGSFRFDAQAFDDLAARVVAAERGFWRDTRPAPVLITAVALGRDDHVINYNGTGRGTDAFATWIDHDAPLGGLAWLLAHEYFHSWNPGELGRLPEINQTRAFWMSEGFSDYYARRLMLRAGLWTPVQFVADWNEMLDAYATSPFRAMPNAEAAAKFWSGDYAAEQIAYQRGAMLAALWDRQLRAKGSDGLDAVLRTQRNRTRAAKVQPLLIDAFVAEMARAGIDIRPDIERYLTHGEQLSLPEDTFGPCAKVIREEAGSPMTGPGAAPGARLHSRQRLVLDSPRFATERETCRAGLAG